MYTVQLDHDLTIDKLSSSLSSLLPSSWKFHLKPTYNTHDPAEKGTFKGNYMLGWLEFSKLVDLQDEG